MQPRAILSPPSNADRGRLFERCALGNVSARQLEDETGSRRAGRSQAG
jgi:hypothetical protein